MICKGSATELNHSFILKVQFRTSFQNNQFYILGQDKNSISPLFMFPALKFYRNSEYWILGTIINFN